MPEEQLLCEHAPGREDADLPMLRAPALEGLGHVGEDVANQLAASVPLLPDLPLQDLQSRRLAIPVHQPLAVARNGGKAGGRGRVGPRRHGLARTAIGGVVVTQPAEKNIVLGR